jgi:geranylgeranyl reductase family protein
LAHDLIVVGGGPAGASCARRAAAKGMDVLVLEKQEHPRRKVCAGGFRPGVTDLLDFDVSPAIEHEACGSHIYSPSRLEVVCTKPKLTGYTVKRSVFDHLLLKKAEEAGAEVQTDIEITDVEEGRENVTVRSKDGQSFTSKYVVAADGVNSRVARSAGIKSRWKDDEVGLCFEACVPMDPSDIMRITQGPYGPDKVCIEVYFGGIQHGYGWCFPKKDEVSLGMGCLVPYAKDLRKAWAKFIDEFEKKNSVKVDLSEESAMRVPLKGPIQNTVTKRIMLAGDAGGFVSPATGEGIYYAIASGQIAADTVSDILQGRAKGTQEYQRRWKSDIGKQLKVSNSLANLLFNSEQNMELIVRMAAKDEVIRGHMTDLIGGLRPYSDLKSSIMKRVISRHPVTGLRLLI